MIINSSNISMSSSRNYSKKSQASVKITQGVVSGKQLLGKRKHVNPTIKANNGVTMTISEESKQMMAKLRQMKRDQQEQEHYRLVSQTDQVNASGVKGEKSEDEVMIETLKRILETLNRVKDSNSFFSEYSSQSSMSAGLSLSQSYMASSQVNLADGRGVNGLWVKQTVASSFMSEEENTAFTSVGNVVTADGHSIDFGITMEMSRSFMEQNEYLKEEAGYIFTDPLTINLDTNVASVSDQKFLFDIDADGDKDSISFLNEGSGFLALDKNGDGKINDGNELFGTKSGDGFKDLAAYDQDGNGWIDEADDVFKNLKVWSKDKDGNDLLVNLKEAGVGALFLGNVSTQFSLNNQETNQTNGMIRSTGVYLKESGEVGTLQHVDLAV